MSEGDPTPEELREAEALSRALESGDAGDAPGEALEAVSLLRASGQPELSDERSQAVLERILPAVRPRVRWSHRTALLGAAAAAAAVLILIPATSLREGRTPIPAPPRTLVQAQMRAAREKRLEPLDAEMRPYRDSVYAALARRYGDSR